MPTKRDPADVALADMATVKATAFRFTQEDLDLLDAIQLHSGISSRTDALRMAIRHYARAEGIELKARRRPRR